MIWCEELGKYGGVFIDENGSIGYKHHYCGKKNIYNGLKTCKLNVENVCSSAMTTGQHARVNSRTDQSGA